MRSKASLGMPGPSSWMKASTWPPSRPRAPAVTVPSGRPYLMALSIRLPSTCSRRSVSARTVTSGMLLTSLACFVPACDLRSSKTFATSGRIGTGCKFSFPRPDSSSEMVNKSSIRSRKRSALRSMDRRNLPATSGLSFAPSMRVSA